MDDRESTRFLERKPHRPGEIRPTPVDQRAEELERDAVVVDDELTADLRTGVGSPPRP